MSQICQRSQVMIIESGIHLLIFRSSDNPKLYHCKILLTDWNETSENLRSTHFFTHFFNEMVTIAIAIENEFWRSWYHLGNFSLQIFRPNIRANTRVNSTGFFPSFGTDEGGNGTSPQERGGVSGSLRQNRCFAAHSPALPIPKSSSCIYLLCGNGCAFLSTRGTRSEY